MDELETNGGTAAASATGEGATPPPSPESRDDAGNAGHTAPPANPAREAFRRLAQGEKPADVNRALFQTSTKDGAASPATAATNDPDRPPQPGPAEGAQPPAADMWPEGMAEKDLNVLRRAQMDPETWSAIPPSNRTKILNNLRASQAAADREFQRGKQQQKPGAAGKPAAGASTQAEGQPSASDTDDVDGAALAGNAADALETADGTPPPTGRKGAAADDSIDVSTFLDPKDLETLEMIGGQELAGTLRTAIGRVAAHYEGRSATLMKGVEYLLDQHIGREFSAATQELADLPGFDALKASTPEAEQLRGKLKEKALFLHRAAGDPKGYSFGDAIKDAAASLFKTNVHQAHQARLLTGRQASLAGSAERGAARTAQARPMTAAERNRAIFRNLQKGLAPDAARAAVDGS